MIPELQIAVDKADLPAQLSMKADGSIDRDGRRAHPTLRPVQGDHPTHRRSREEDVSRGEARQQALDPGEQLGWMEGFDEVVVRAGSRPRTFCSTSRSAVSMMIGTCEALPSSPRILVATW